MTENIALRWCHMRGNFADRPRIMTRRFLRRILLSLLALGLLAPADARPTPQKDPETESVKKEITRIERQYQDALLANDLKNLTALMADDFLYVGTNAEILSKAQRIAQLRSKAVAYEALQQDDLRVVVYGDTVIVSGRNTSTLQIGGKGSWGPGGASHLINPGRLSGNALFTHAYVRLQGRWQMILEHMTYITED